MGHRQKTCCYEASWWKLDVVELRSLAALGGEALRKAHAAGDGRAVETVVGGRDRLLRHVVIALVAGAALGEHDNPGEATVYVLRGRVRLDAADGAVDGRTGDLIVVPTTRHDLQAVTDAVVLLTTVRRA
jgi:quercetin dioxygenase-like cupin family protein